MFSTHARTYKCVYVVIAVVVLKESYTRILICRQNQWLSFFVLLYFKPPNHFLVNRSFTQHFSTNTHTHSYLRSNDFQFRGSLCKKHFPTTSLCSCVVTSENQKFPRQWDSGEMKKLLSVFCPVSAVLTMRMLLLLNFLHFSWDFLVMIWLSLFSGAPADVRFLVPLTGKKVTVRAPAPALASLTKPRQSSRSLLSNIKKGVGVSKLKKCALDSNRKSAGEVQERPLRERVTHLLALRPYKRPELILRLQKDGLTAGDKDTLDSVLSEVKNILLTPDKYTSD